MKKGKSRDESSRICSFFLAEVGIMKLDYEIRFPVSRYMTHSEGVRDALEMLMYAYSEIQVHPISDEDTKIDEVSNLPKWEKVE